MNFKFETSKIKKDKPHLVDGYYWIHLSARMSGSTLYLENNMHRYLEIQNIPTQFRKVQLYFLGDRITLLFS